MVKLVIFDMDGVLIDSEHAITLAALEALEKGWHIKAKFDDFKQFTGMGEDKFIGGVAQMYGVPYELAMKDATYDIYCATARERVSVYGWSKPLTSELVRRGYKIAVASAADVVKVRCNLECIGVSTDMFSAIITGSDVTRHKPDPEVFLKAAEQAGERPEDCVVFEDAVSGIHAAKAAGMKGIAVTSSFDRQRLLEAGADVVLDSLDRAYETVESM